MTDKLPKSPADVLFAAGMKYNLQQDKSLAAATWREQPLGRPQRWVTPERSVPTLT
jgi:hypothetical protein